jgi:predicted transcriptional regulator
MTTRDKVLQIRTEQPNAHAAQIAQIIGVTTGRVYQLLKELGLATTIPGAKKGRPRKKAALWVSRKRKASNIRKRLESGEAYTEANGTTWWFVTELTPQWGQVVVSTWSGAVKTGERIYPSIDAALEAEV